MLRRVSAKIPALQAPRRRPRADEAALSHCATGSDSERATVDESTPHTKRRKLQHGSPVCVTATAKNSGDDPLTSCSAATPYTPTHVTCIVPSSSRDRDQIQELALPAFAVTWRMLSSSPAASTPCDSDRISREADERSKTTPIALSPKTLIHREEPCLTPGRQSGGDATSPSLGPTPSINKSKSYWRVPTPGRVFTKLKLVEVNHLILLVKEAEKHAHMEQSAQSSEGTSDANMAADDSDDSDTNADQLSDLTDAYADGCVEGAVGSTDDVGHSGEDYYPDHGSENIEDDRSSNGSDCASFVAKLTRIEAMGNHRANDQGSVATRSRSPIDDAAHTTSVPELKTMGKAALVSPDPLLTSPDSPTFTERLFTKSPSPRRPAELSQRTQEREGIFLRGFTIQWWAGGMTIHNATRSVNAALSPHIPRFSQDEGSQRLLALSAQRKLVIRHSLVYHLDQDPGPSASVPPLHVAAKYSSPSAILARELHNTGMQLVESPYGDISEARFKVLKIKLHSAVVMQETLFNNTNKVETLPRCIKGLNEWMAEEHKFSLGEVKAAMKVLHKTGTVILKGDEVTLERLE